MTSVGLSLFKVNSTLHTTYTYKPFETLKVSTSYTDTQSNTLVSDALTNEKSGTKLWLVGCFLLLKFMSQVTFVLLCISNILVTTENFQSSLLYSKCLDLKFRMGYMMYVPVAVAARSKA